ncbi:MAG TPA: hypothetical protein VE441_14110 [Mycobacterium sp.]|nr:hypothetical protein [Mycobacterium sp.]
MIRPALPARSAAADLGYRSHPLRERDRRSGSKYGIGVDAQVTHEDVEHALTHCLLDFQARDRASRQHNRLNGRVVSDHPEARFLQHLHSIEQVVEQGADNHFDTDQPSAAEAHKAAVERTEPEKWLGKRHTGKPFRMAALVVYEYAEVERHPRELRKGMGRIED